MGKLLFLFCLFASESFARIANVSEAPVSILGTETYTIEKDGSYHLETRTILTIQNEQGRKDFGSLFFNYSPTISRVKNIKGKTLNKKVETLVSEEQISDKPLAVDNTVFDHQHRVTLSYPKVEVGSELHISWEEENYAPLFPNHFSYFRVGSELPILKGTRYRFISKIPLSVESNRPDIFSIHQSVEGEVQTTEIELKDLFYTHVVEEKFGQFPNKNVPKIFISSARNYDEVLKQLTDEYQEKISQEIPSEFKDILEQAKSKQDFFDQANTIMALLADRIRYMGDLRTVKGRFLARNLKDIALSAYGDCKDYSTLTLALLRKLGYSADIALVQRTLNPPLEIPKTVIPTAFNHTIVHVELNGRSVWLDPTNPTSLSKFSRADIANRESLILKKDHAKPAFIASNAPEDDAIEKTLEYTFKANGISRLLSKTTYLGIRASWIRDTNFHLPHESLVHSLLTSRTKDHIVQSINKTEIPEIKTRFPGDYTWFIDLDFNSPRIQTSMGKGFEIETKYEEITKVDVETYTNGIFLNLPGIYKEKVILNGVKLKGSHSKCKVDSKWLTYERNIRQVKNRIEVDRTYKSLKYAIKNEELKTPAFKKLQDDLKLCDASYIIIFE